MPKFTITEYVTATIEIEADSAQEALDTWLNSGHDAALSYSEEVTTDREVVDESGDLCDTEG